MKSRLTIWQKLTIPAFAVGLVSALGYLPLKLFPQLRPGWEWVLPVWWGSYFVSTSYLTGYSIWHWRTRYAGQRPFAWALAFVYSMLMIPGFCYFWAHILPDLQQHGLYAPDRKRCDPPLPLPPKHEITKSFCFFFGWILILIAAILALISITFHASMLPVVEDTIQSKVPKGFTQYIAEGLLMLVDSYKMTVWSLGGGCLLAAAGGVMLYISQRISWRKIEYALALEQDGGSVEPADESKEVQRLRVKADTKIVEPYKEE